MHQASSVDNFENLLDSPLLDPNVFPTLICYNRAPSYRLHFLQSGKPVWQVMDVRHLDAPGGPHSDHQAVMARLAHVHAHG
jgi:hypothetical protein